MVVPQFAISVVIWIAALSGQDELESNSRTVFIRNSFPLSVFVWVDGDAIGRIAMRSTEKLVLDITDNRSSAELVLASIDKDGNAFGSAIMLDLTGASSSIDCWYGGVRPPYAADRESAKSVTKAPTPAGLFLFVQHAFADGRDAQLAPGELSDGGNLSPDSAFSRVVIGSTHPVRKKITNSVGMKLIEIFPGEFRMGCPPSEEGFSAPERQHVVWLTESFFISETEVTQAQWIAVMADNPSHFRGKELPVDSISWLQANEFCEKLSKKDGRTYRLPTEAEWEYACRAGTTTAYSFGPSAYILHRRFINNYAWTNLNSGGTTHPVGSKRPNRWGLYDMHGNVLEWCSDWWSWRYPIERVENPTGPDAGNQKTARGGGWPYDPIQSRSAARHAMPPDLAPSTVGFRVVLNKP